MSDVRLVCQNDGAIPLQSGVILLPQWRIRAWIRLGGEIPLRQAIVDTGAPVTVLSKSVWEPFHKKGVIRWVTRAPGSRGPTQTLSRVAVHGSRFPFHLGRISVQFAELSRPNALRPVEVLAQCLEDLPSATAAQTSVRRLLILGLAGGVFPTRELSVRFNSVGEPVTADVVEP